MELLGRKGISGSTLNNKWKFRVLNNGDVAFLVRIIIVYL